MPTYSVLVREVHVVQVTVKANDPEEAIKKVEGQDESCEWGYTEYSHTLDPEEWTAEVINVD